MHKYSSSLSLVPHSLIHMLIQVISYTYVTLEPQADVLAREIIGKNVMLLNSTIVGGFCTTSNSNANCEANPMCRQFGTFVNGSGVTTLSLNNGVSDAVFMRRGITISTGSVSYANLVNNSLLADEVDDAVNRDDVETTTVPELEDIADEFTYLYDVAALRVWFQAEGDESVNISISYIFASEEYNEYINYPDLFGLFLDGVQISVANDGSPLSAGTVNMGKERGMPPFSGTCGTSLSSFSFSSSFLNSYYPYNHTLDTQIRLSWSCSTHKIRNNLFVTISTTALHPIVPRSMDLLDKRSQLWKSIPQCLMNS